METVRHRPNFWQTAADTLEKMMPLMLLRPETQENLALKPCRSGGEKMIKAPVSVTQLLAFLETG